MQQKQLITLCLVLILSLVLYRCKKPVPNTPQLACFNYSEATVLVGQPDTFTNCSADTGSFLWSFGDGDTDKVDKSPIHIYQTTGLDTVKLFTFNPGTDTALAYKLVNIITNNSNFTGNYRGAEVCTLAGTDTTGYTITSNGTSGLLFSNLYNLGKSFTATYSGLNGTIPGQNFSGDSMLLGNFTLSHDTIFLSLIVTAFSFRDNCTGIYVKH
jgi:hypothetical protein